MVGWGFSVADKQKVQFRVRTTSTAMDRSSIAKAHCGGKCVKLRRQTVHKRIHNVILFKYTHLTYYNLTFDILS